MTAQLSHRPAAGPWPRVTLAGVAFDAVTEPQCVGWIMDQLAAGRGGWVITPNLDHLRRAQRDQEFRRWLLEEADLVVADGMPLVWASRLQGTPLPERVAGSSLVSTLAQAAAGAGRSLFLLGGSPGAAQAAAEVLRSRYPGLIIAGTACPPIGFENDPQQMDELRQMLKEAKPDIVYMALGSPKQERLIRLLRGEQPGAWWLGVGISLSFLCGQVRRAPRWMQRVGLEWLHRLVQEPRRLARRYLLDGIPFALYLLGGAALQRGRRLKARRREVSQPGAS
ncbi:MAG TPA: WecB/TagA/CpsF family glycosyltransferase [Phycisphaeraceae bacterium]